MKYELALSTPIMNAAGCLGYAPDLRSQIDYSQFGAFITNPVSWSKRSPANAPRVQYYPGGFLLHTGFPNPGFDSVLRHYVRQWAQSPLPVIVHILAEDVFRTAHMVEQLESLEGVVGIEIGLPPDVHPTDARELALAALGELPVLVRVPWEGAEELIQVLQELELSFFSLSPPRGVLLGPQGELVQGRLYGRALFPMALSIVRRTAALGSKIIGAGGVYTKGDVDAMFAAGAKAVQIDAALWGSTLWHKSAGGSP